MHVCRTTTLLYPLSSINEWMLLWICFYSSLSKRLCHAPWVTNNLAQVETPPSMVSYAVTDSGPSGSGSNPVIQNLSSCCVVMGTLTVPFHSHDNADFDEFQSTPQRASFSYGYVQIRSRKQQFYVCLFVFIILMVVVVVVVFFWYICFFVLVFYFP